jgi:hypothetical protein
MLALSVNHTLQTIVAGGTNEVGSVQPVKDFNDMLGRRDVDLVDKAIGEMEKRILQLVNDSIRDQFYAKALECLVALRHGCVKVCGAHNRSSAHTHTHMHGHLPLMLGGRARLVQQVLALDA